MVQARKPDWSCYTCNYQLYLGNFDECPQVCPECGSSNVVCHRLKTMSDPPLKKNFSEINEKK